MWLAYIFVFAIKKKKGKKESIKPPRRAHRGQEVRRAQRSGSDPWLASSDRTLCRGSLVLMRCPDV